VGKIYERGIGFGPAVKEGASCNALPARITIHLSLTIYSNLADLRLIMWSFSNRRHDLALI